MDSKNNCVEINILDLIFVVLKKLIVMLIVGAILGGALFSHKVMKRLKTNDVLDPTTKLNDSETDVQYELRVQKINKARTIYEMISNVNKQIDHQKSYIANSIYMQIDAENVYLSTAQITLTLENNDTNGIDNALLGAYERDIRAGNYLDEYAAKIGTRPDYIKELVSFSSTVPNNTIINVDSNVDRVGSMYITVFGPTREFSDEVMDLVINEVERVYHELNTSITNHSISLVGVQQIVKMDSSIRDVQVGQTGTIDTLQRQITSYNDQLDKVAKDLGLTDKEDILNYFEEHNISYEIANPDEVPSDYSERNISRLTMIKPGIKVGLIGFIIGALLVTIFVVFKYLFGNKILTQTQFFSMFPFIRKIGVTKPVGKRSKFIRFIDVKTEDDTKINAEKCNGLISANYSNLTKDLNKVLITGTADTKAMGDAVKALGLKGDFKPDIFNNPEVLSSVPDYEGVVLLEQRNISLKKNVDKEICLINNAGTKIIGAIII